MFRRILISAAGLSLVSGSLACAPTSPPVALRASANDPPAIAQTVPVIQLAILLDTSGSMDGLINQTRSRIWDVVNVMTTARKHGRCPDIQVALYQYGSSLFSPGEGYLTMIQPFTPDLDLLSSRLFALRIGGSEEFCGQVMDSALRQLSWNPTSPSAPVAALPLRMVIIAGNEEFSQGPVDYRGPAESAKVRGVLVNTIYCGSVNDGAATGWRSGAMIGGGAYCTIDQNQRIIETPSPQDDRLLALNAELNASYIPFGSVGAERQTMQTAQDSANVNLSKSGGLSRVMAKSSANYRNDHWDLVDAVGSKSVELEKIKSDDLPENMRSMTLTERRAFVEHSRARRTEIQDRIRTLSLEREAFLRDRREKPAGDTLDSAIIKTIREQAVRAGFTFTPD